MVKPRMWNGKLSATPRSRAACRSTNGGHTPESRIFGAAHYSNVLERRGVYGSRRDNQRKTPRPHLQRSSASNDRRLSWMRAPWSIATDAKVSLRAQVLPNPEEPSFFWPRALNRERRNSQPEPADQRFQTRTWFPTASMKLTAGSRRHASQGPAHWLSLEDKRLSVGQPMARCPRW